MMIGKIGRRYLESSIPLPYAYNAEIESMMEKIRKIILFFVSLFEMNNTEALIPIRRIGNDAKN